MSEVKTAAAEQGEESLREEERKWFSSAIRALNEAGVPFLMAGAFGLHHYTGFWRNTKDMDVLVLPEDRERAIEALSGIGLEDLYEQEPYDREWIYRSTREGVIVDVIWRLANKQDDVDRSWFERATEGTFVGLPVRFTSAADLCWMKLFVFQAKRCDWPDIINVIRGTQGRLDWQRLLQQVGPHWRLLCALTDIYDWLCPEERAFIPDSFRKALETRRRTESDPGSESRKDLFDSRPWLTGAGAGHPGAPGMTATNGKMTAVNVNGAARLV